MSDELTAWLRRIGVDGRPEPSVATLNRVIGQQLRSIPFENVTVLCNEVPALDRDALRRKLIAAGRGGYCFELNGLLAAGLEGLGFDVRPVLARVLWGREAPGPRSHLLLRVKAEGTEWLADAGFGGPGPDVAIRLDPDTAAERTGPCSLVREPGIGTVVSRVMPDGRSAALYGFMDEYVAPSDIEAANWLTATWPASVFRTRLMAAIGDAPDRATLDGHRFVRMQEGAQVEEQHLATLDEVAACMRASFGIALTAAQQKALGQTIDRSAA